MPTIINNGTGDDHDGDAGIIIEGNTGPIHLGTGNIITNSVTVTGPGAVYVAGDHHGGISYGTSRKGKRDEGRTGEQNDSRARKGRRR
ncbi:hypothetical protein [Nonomuraea salmonea]|uniref:Uncharacterized protein n=1 Tax=Nonomuraea salmonea TaxID=46181 RepID=A0ABV5P389_9ACTN